MRYILVGTGHMGQRYLELNDSRLQGVVRARAALGSGKREVPAYFTIKEALSKSGAEAALIASPLEHHFDHALEALECGAHVLVEKPLCRSSDEWRALQEIAERKGLKLKSALPLRHHPVWHRFIEEARRLPQPLKLGFTLLQPLDIVKKERLKLYSPFLDIAPHYLDISLQILGECASLKTEALQSTEWVRSTLLYPDGSEAALEFAWSEKLQPRAERFACGGGRRLSLEFDGLTRLTLDGTLLSAEEPGWSRLLRRQLDDFFEGENYDPLEGKRVELLERGESELYLNGKVEVV